MRKANYKKGIFFRLEPDVYNRFTEHCLQAGVSIRHALTEKVLDILREANKQQKPVSKKKLSD